MAVEIVLPGLKIITATANATWLDFTGSGIDGFYWRLNRAIHPDVPNGNSDVFTLVDTFKYQASSTPTFAPSATVHLEQGYYYQFLCRTDTTDLLYYPLGNVFYCEPVAKPLTPTLTAPATGASDMGLEVTLEWTNGTYADSVSLQVGTDFSSFNTILDKLIVTPLPTQHTMLLQPDTTYYWRVVNHNVSGDTYSTAGYFTTKTALPTGIDTSTYTAGTISWATPSAMTPDGYDVYIGTDLTEITQADRKSKLLKATVTGGTSYNYSSSAMPDTLYYVRIDAFALTNVYDKPSITPGKVHYHFTGSATLVAAVTTHNVEKVIAISGSKLYYGNDSAFASIELGINDNEKVDTLCAFNKCFVVNGTTLKVVDFTNTKLTVSAVSPVPPRDTILYQDTGTSVKRAVIDFIDGTDIYAQVVNGIFAAGAIYWIDSKGDKQSLTITGITNAPTFYTWKTYPDTTSGEYANGEMPEDVDIVELYQGQVVLASSKNNIFYMSAPNNPFKFAYYEEASGFASALGYTGKLGQNITAVIPFSDDYLILGTATQTWMFRGSPSSGATLDSVSNSIGVFNNECWTMDGSGTLYFMNANGIYSFTGNSLNSLTADVFPRFNSEFTVATGYYLSMAYDKYNNGIMISSTGTSDHKTLLYSLDTGGFFEMTFGDIGGITSAIFDETKLIVGCKDGAIKYFDADAKDDFSEYRNHVIDSAVQFGVFRLTNDELFTSLLESIEIYCGKESDLVLKIFNGLTADAVINKIIADTPAFTGTITQIRSKTFNVRLRGSYFSIAIENDMVNSSWAMERIAIKGKQFGKVRLI